MPTKVDYKTFTAHVETETLLDDFAPTYIKEIEDRFEPINHQKQELCKRINYYDKKLCGYKKFKAAAEILSASSMHINTVFEDFQKRMEYFTIVFFGAVSAGKTSMICDLANMNPNKLTQVISQQSGFVSEKDAILIGPNVATINLYEILIKKSRIRLVDIPGIGGVVHKNDSIAPFVDMADVVAFLLDANSDITKDDYDFIYDHVAAAEHSEEGKKNARFTAERGLDKKALVIINKWKNAYQSRPPAHAERDWERKSKWILEGDPDKNFDGIKGLFTKDPVVVRANTSFRDEETGECYPDETNLFYMDEVVCNIEEILRDEGAALRLNRPRQILGREITKLIEKLAQEKTQHSIDNLVDELAGLGIRIDAASGNMQIQFDSRLSNLERNIKDILSPQIKRILNDWKPKVGFLNQMKMIVPEWFPGASNAGLGKTNVQVLVKKIWQTEIRELIKNEVDYSRIESLVKQEAETLATLISNGFRFELAGATPQLMRSVSSLSTSVQNDSIGKEDAVQALKSAINQAVKRIESDILRDILTIVTFDAILVALAGAILTPAGSFVVAMVRRWMRGEKKQREIRQEVESAVDEAVGIASMNIRNQVAERVRQGIEDTATEIRKVLDREQKTLSEPVQVIDQAISELKDFQSTLESLTLK